MKRERRVLGIPTPEKCVAVNVNNGRRCVLPPHDGRHRYATVVNPDAWYGR